MATEAGAGERNVVVAIWAERRTCH